MTHKITIQFEVDASDWEYPENGLSHEEQMELDLIAPEELIVAIYDQEYTVKVEKL